MEKKGFRASVEFKQNFDDIGLTEIILQNCVWVKDKLAQHRANGIYPVFIKGINGSEKTDMMIERLRQEGGLNKENYEKYLPLMLPKGLRNAIWVRNKNLF